MGMFGGSPRGTAFARDHASGDALLYMRSSSRREEVDELCAYLVQFGSADRTCTIQDDARLSRKEAIWTDVAGLPHAAAGKVTLDERYRIAIHDRLARDLAEDDIIAGKCCHH